MTFSLWGGLCFLGMGIKSCCQWSDVGKRRKWRSAWSVCRLLQHPPNTVCTAILPGLSAYCCKTSCLLINLGRDVGYADYPERVRTCGWVYIIHTSVLSLFLEFTHVIDWGDIFRKKNGWGDHLSTILKLEIYRFC